MSLKQILEELGTVKTPDHTLDMKVWAALEGHDWPIPHYAQNFYEAAVRQGEAACRAATDLGSAMRLADELLPGVQWQITRATGTVSCTMTAEVNGYPARSGEPRAFPVGCEAVAMTHATIECHVEIQKQYQAWLMSPAP